MRDPNTPDPPPDNTDPEASQIFKRLLDEHPRPRGPEGGKQIEGTVIAVDEESVLLDIGRKTEGALPLSELRAGEQPQPGDKMLVTIKARDPEGYYAVSRFNVARPTDWDALERAFAEKSTIIGNVTGVVKGGLTVDVGVRAFLPASRSGARDAAEMERLVEQEIRCRITKLDVASEDVVVDRRVVLEEEERAEKSRRFEELQEGDVVRGQVRSLTDYGAFVDVGGVDGLLHVGEMAWGRVSKPSDVLAVGQEIEARIIKLDREKRRISLSLKQLLPHPWEGVPGKYNAGERVRGVVTRVADFGAFVELEPGVEGLIHISEMSWGKKVRTAGDVVRPGDTMEAVILGVNTEERRISLGLKQALGDPWAEAESRFAPGAVVEGTVTRLAPFGAFVELAEGVEGLVHVSEISAEKRINHPQDVLKSGQPVKALVLAVDKEKRQLRLSLKQLVPTSLDEYIAEHKPGDVVSGRVVELAGAQAKVELGEGIYASCRIPAHAAETAETPAAGGLNLGALTSMLSARWKGSAPGQTAKPEPVRAAQVRSFRITRLDADAKRIELELA